MMDGDTRRFEPARIEQASLSASAQVSPPKTIPPVRTAYYRARREITKLNKALTIETMAQQRVSDVEQNQTAYNVAIKTRNREAAEALRQTANADPDKFDLRAATRALDVTHATVVAADGALSTATNLLWSEVGKILKRGNKAQLKEAIRRALYCNKHQEADTAMMGRLLDQFDKICKIDSGLARRIARLVVNNTTEDDPLGTRALDLAQAKGLLPKRGRWQHKEPAPTLAARIAERPAHVTAAAAMKVDQFDITG